MRTVKRDLLALITLTLLGALSLAGCAPAPAPQASETNGPTEAPVFASDEEALAAATEAYAAYLAASDAISGEGGIEPERMAPLVSAQLFKSELDGFDGFVDANAHSVGTTSFVVYKLQSAEYLNPAQTNIYLYVCEDVTDLSVIDSTGKSLVSPSRQAETPFEVHLTMNAVLDLILEDRVVWRGENFC